MLRLASAAFILLATAHSLHAAVWQYAVTVRPEKYRLLLYIPPECVHLRGAIIALGNLAEKPLLQDPLIRETAAAENLGIVWIHGFRNDRSFNDGFKLSRGDGGLLDEMLSELAKESGYAELSKVPLLAIGHSGGTGFAADLAAALPDRVFAVILLKSWAGGSAQGIPILVVKGQFEEWATPGQPLDREQSWRRVREVVLRERSESERHLAGFLLDVGGGHFEVQENLTRLLAMFIRKAARYRLDPTSHKPRPLAPESGWLTDSRVAVETNAPIIAKHTDFPGSPKTAFWYLDQELAQAVRTFGRDQLGKKPQMVSFSTNAEPIALTERGPCELQFHPSEDGRTFRLGATFFDRVPNGLVQAGEPLGHGQGACQVRVITGAVAQLGPDTFRFEIDQDELPVRGVWLLAYHPGDERLRPAVQPGRLVLPATNTVGRPQKISFLELPDQTQRTQEIVLNATTDSGLPVEYFVANGPAEVVGTKLRLTRIPPRSRFPVRVTVVACQFGRVVEPLYQSAEQVTRTFHVIR